MLLFRRQAVELSFSSRRAHRHHQSSELHDDRANQAPACWNQQRQASVLSEEDSQILVKGVGELASRGELAHNLTLANLAPTRDGTFLLPKSTQPSILIESINIESITSSCRRIAIKVQAL